MGSFDCVSSGSKDALSKQKGGASGDAPPLKTYVCAVN
jgi:hypothetical protein